MEDRSLTVAAPIRATTVREWFPAKEKHIARNWASTSARYAASTGEANWHYRGAAWP
jgi:hypothetical protein